MPVAVLFSPSVCLDDIYLGLDIHHKRDADGQLAKWPPFVRELLIRFTLCSLCILTYSVNF